MKTIVNKNSTIYYKELYWNDYPEVRSYINNKITGNPELEFVDYFKQKYAKKPFANALFLNCGNGWVERMFLEKKIVKKADAFDYSKDLINQAEKNKGKLPINYFKSDVNKLRLSKDKYDLVVNYAALHHTQYINKVSLEVAKSLKPDGILFNFDYIGPHRNQYPFRQWSLIKTVNKSLPAKYQHAQLFYPHIPTMLVTDPTEAIHSELIIETLARYFDFIEKKDCNGGIAYMLLSLNKNIPLKGAKKHILQILKLDDEYTKKKKVPALFSFFICAPKKDIFKDKTYIKKMQLEENKREKNSLMVENTYYLPQRIKLLIHGRRNFRMFIKRLFGIVKFYSSF